MTLKVVVGERYGYRQHPRTIGDPLTCVEVLKLGPPTARPKRVRVRHLEGEYEDLDEWVSQSGLVAPWEEAADLMKDEHHTVEAIEASGEVDETIQWLAVQEVLWSLPFPLCNRVCLGPTAATRELIVIEDLYETAPRIGFEAEELISEPFAFIDRFGSYKAPFQAALKVAKRICTNSPSGPLGSIRAEEAALRKAVVTGQYVYPNNPEIQYEMSRPQVDEELKKQEPVFALMREWCGEAATTEFDQISALQDEVERLRSLVRSTAQWLKEAGHPAKGRMLMEELNRG